MQRLIDRAVPAPWPDTPQVDQREVDSKNSCVRVSAAARKTLIARYRRVPRGQPIALGVHPTVSIADARRHARVTLGEVARAEDSARERWHARRPSFAGLAAPSLDRHGRVRTQLGCQVRRAIEDERHAKWGTGQASGFRRGDCRNLVDASAERSTLTLATRGRALINKIRNFDILRDTDEFNPSVQFVPPAQEVRCDHPLSDLDMRALWIALDNELPEITAAVLLRLRAGVPSIGRIRRCFVR